MEYPVWQLSTLAGGFWIALIATTHVFVSHFAVGGGLFLVLTESRARRENSSELLEFVRGHTWFFLLLTMVFGGISGVGIWFIISVLAPAATSSLIHIFVWGWATEWVFFIGEIVALLIYHYSFQRMKPRDHMVVGWLYFLFAWLSLFIINGVIGFMLTPGDWLTTENFWDGFFNPTFWPSLVFRSLMAFMLAGLFGFLTALRIPGEATRTLAMRMCASWAMISLPLMLLAGWWYLSVLPADVHAFITQKSQEITPYFKILPVASVVVMAGSLVMALRLPRGPRMVVAGILLVAGFAIVGAFEFVREAGRKPWIIHGHTWAQGVRLEQVGELDEPFL
ncbi:MAG: cytochrome C, partial [Deltaproteobacteria bacterium]|nr:cytochrome C [Deltaproteobacteria bacterium]